MTLVATVIIIKIVITIIVITKKCCICLSVVAALKKSNKNKIPKERFYNYMYIISDINCLFASSTYHTNRLKWHLKKVLTNVLSFKNLYWCAVY